MFQFSARGSRSGSRWVPAQYSWELQTSVGWKEGGRTVSLWVLTSATSLSTLKFLIRTAVKKQGCTYALVMWTILIRTICLLTGTLNIPRMTYSPVASIPFYLEGWLCTDFSTKRDQCQLSEGGRVSSRKPISSVQLDPFLASNYVSSPYLP